MKRIGLVVSALVVGTLAFAQSADAQTRFGIAAGIAVPTGDFGRSLSSGFNVEGSVEFKPMTMPFGVRADLGYNRFGLDNSATDASFRTIAGALNALFQMSGIGAAPYLVVGPTITNISAGGSSQTKVGAQGGVGVKFPLSGFTSKIEGRFNTIFAEATSISGESTNFNMFIVNFGILFGGVE